MISDPASGLVVLAMVWTADPYRLEVIPMDAATCDLQLRMLWHREDIASECMPIQWWFDHEERRKRREGSK
jgi:hypothetical protein